MSSTTSEPPQGTPNSSQTQPMTMSSIPSSPPDTPCPPPRLTREEEARDHRNLVSRRRRREITFLRRAHELHRDCNTEVFVLITHNDDYKNVIYNSEPGEDFPRPYEKLKIMYPRPEINTPSDPQYTLQRALERITAIRAREAGSVRANGARGIRGPRVANRLGQDGLDGHHNVAELIQGAGLDGHVSIGYVNMDSHDTAGNLSQPAGFEDESIGYDNIGGHGNVDGHHNAGNLSQPVCFDGHEPIGHDNIEGHDNMDGHHNTGNLNQPAGFDGHGSIGYNNIEGHDNIGDHHNAGNLSQPVCLDGHEPIGHDNIVGFGQLVGFDNLGEFGHGVRLDGLPDLDNSVGLDDLAGPDHVGEVHDSGFPRGVHPATEPFSPSPHLNTRGADGFSLSGGPVSRSDAALSTGGPVLEDMAGLGTAEVDAAEVVSTPSVPGARGRKRPAPLDFYIPIPVRRLNSGLQVRETVGQTTPPPRTCSPPPTPVRRWTRRQSRSMAHPGWHRRGRSGN